MKTKFKLLAAVTMAFGLFSCNSDDGLDNTAPNEPGILGNAETYATIRIAMPGGGEATGRAFTKTDPENGDDFEKGTETENTFNSVSLYFFDGHISTSTCKGVLTMDKSLFSQGENTEDKTIIYTSTAQKVGIEGVDMSVYAVVNGGISGVNTGTKLTDFLGKTVTTSEAINDSWLLMSSRTPGKVTISADTNKTEETAASLSVSVERTAAKITYKAENTTPGQENQYSVKSEKEPLTEVATVTLTDYKLVNLRNDAYFFRKVAGSNGEWLTEKNFGNGKQTGNNYVIDPKFAEKTVEAAKDPDFKPTWFGEGKAYAANGDTYTVLPKVAEHTRLGYCMENTMGQDAQLNGYSTGIIFKATYTPKKVNVLKQDQSGFEEKDYEPGTAFYRYANALYKMKNEVINYYKLSEDTDLIDEYKGDNAKGATCYYKYWIKHMDNGNAEQMGIMEFAIVRNNAYKLSVNKVSGLGDPDDTIDPETPDETSKMYLDVKVTILPWVVRNNEGIIL
ncbi:MAG: Mfa1 family fimbria major subunit [Odoribacter splanchnicus]